MEAAIAAMEKIRNEYLPAYITLEEYITALEEAALNKIDLKNV